ncbi:MAG: tRNA (adenosine(37)-N6)-threonylcarbamoyltransferase complex dimerization subunit type 1 TsaB [Gammaproteobacteria bacterium]|nr:tRNA (adenosine(37)-N6)-threonylcarbamoyltransferase complex dimerization subunit type 1 TsaB [Gammaproteobacteria bacterium]
MNILALETSTEACSVALLTNQGKIFSEFELTPRQHTRYLPAMLDSVLNQAKLKKSELTHIAYASGPGAFTGVRIAASTAQGLSIGLGLPLVPVSTLAVLAQQASDLHHVNKVLATLDARMGEAYIALYQTNPATHLVKLQGEEKLIKLAALNDPEGYYLAGSGFKAKREAALGAVDGALDEDILPHAAALVKLAKHSIETEKAGSTKPVLINYIRNNVAIKKKQPVL